MSVEQSSFRSPLRFTIGVFAFAFCLSACSEKDQAALPITAASNNSSSLSSSSGRTNTVVANRTITVGRWPANVPVSCDLLNPDAIKSLSTETIQWLAEIFPSGLTRHEHFVVVRDTGYEGEIGQGGHDYFLDSQAGRRESFERMSTAFANQSMLPTWPNFREHHVQVRQSGYQGIFLCGGHNCWIAGGCDNLGRRK